MINEQNISAVNTNRALKFQNWKVGRDTEKLSFIVKTNRSGEDATWPAVSEKARLR